MLTPAKQFLACTVRQSWCNKKLFQNHLEDKVKKLRCYRRLTKMTLLQFLSLCIFPKLRYSSKYFAQINRAQYGAAMLVYLRCTLTWRPENSVNIWILLWTSRRRIIWTEQTSIYINTFPNALTFQKAKNHEIGIRFSTNAIVALCHALP